MWSLITLNEKKCSIEPPEKIFRNYELLRNVHYKMTTISISPLSNRDARRIPLHYPKLN